MITQDVRMKLLIDHYEDDAYHLIGEHISKRAIEPFTKFLCSFCLEDEAINLMEVMDLKRIHIAALERNQEDFYELLRKQEE